MKHSDQRQLRVEKGLFHIIPQSHSSALKEVKTETEAEAWETCHFPAQTLAYGQLLSLYSPNVPA